MNYRKKTVWKAACLAMVLLTAGAAGAAAPSDKISYQGFLTDDLGTPIDASVNMAAGFYNVSGGGTSLYAESHAAVTVSKGQFNLLLGAGTMPSGTWAGLDFTQALWIEITAGTETLSPRIPMSSVSYSRYAFTVADGSVSASKLNGSPGNGTAGELLSSNGSGGFSWASGVSAALIGSGSVDNTEFGYLDGITASIQTQLNAKGAGDMLKADNLSGLANYTTARTNLGLGGLAALNSVSSAEITDGTIADADVSGTAAIADTKLATISTAGKVSNSATTADSANTANAIVARDASGNFAAGTATLSGLAVTGGTPGLNKVLTSDASGNATWQTLSVTESDPTVNASVKDGVSYSELQNNAGGYMSYLPNNTACLDTQILKWDDANSRWICAGDIEGV